MTKRFSIVSLLALPLLAGGCLAPPAHSPRERHQQISRNWNYEARQAVDDWDHLLLLRPASRLTIWNVR